MTAVARRLNRAPRDAPDRLYRSRVDRMIMVSLLVAMALLWLVPIASAVDRALVFNGWRNFSEVITGDIGGITLWQTYWNSFAIAFLHAAMVVGVSSLAGYGFAKFEFRGKEAMYYVTLVFLAVPATSVLVPLFFITRELDLRDTYLGVALPEAALTMPFGVLLMRNFAETIPDTYIEAASMDGASHLRTFAGVFLPMSRPALLSLGCLSVMWSLQDFLFPALLLSDHDKTTAAQAVFRFKEYLAATPDDIGKYNASLVLLAVPALLVVLAGLRFIIRGLAAGGIKE